MARDPEERRKAPDNVENRLKFVVLNTVLRIFIFLTIAMPIYGCAGVGSKNFSYSITLAWDAPTVNTDGSALTDLAGYKIHYRTSPNNYDLSKDVGRASCKNIGNKTECSSTVEGLRPSTYYFAVTAYDTSGNESAKSNEVVKTIE